MYLRDLAFGADPEIVERYQKGFVATFARHSHCMVELFLSHLYRRISTPDTAKVCIVGTDQLNRPPKESEVQVMINVLAFPWPFDFMRYERADNREKKELMVQGIHDGLMWIGKIREWDVGPIDEALRACRNEDYRFEGFWTKKTWTSPNKKHRIKVYFVFDLDEVKLFAVLFDRKNNKLGKTLIATHFPVQDAIRALVGEGKWKSAKKFELKSNSTYWKHKWTVDLGDLV